MRAALPWLGLSACVAAAVWAIWLRLRQKRLLRRLDEMLDAAIGGVFLETSFDESRISALESKLARYLRTSAMSARQVAAERDRITGLIADISHQTKTPVANLLLYAQLLGEEELSAKGRQCAEALSQQSEKLRFLVDALVKASRLEAGILALHPVPGEVLPVVQQVVETLLPKAQAKGVRLTAQTGEAHAVFDEKWTVEALHNLVDNAIKYTPAGGAVTVGIQTYELFCRICVTDTGPGIAEAEQAKIFGRFYRSAGHARDEGVGLGLYLAREIARAEDGYIKVSSTVGKGATFSLFLPTAGANVSNP